MDSFNDLLKFISKSGVPPNLASSVKAWRETEHGWLSLVADIEKGRSLRDKLAHQTEFPLCYVELRSGSEKESPAVRLEKTFVLPLPEFINRLRIGVIDCFLSFEQELSAVQSGPPTPEESNGASIE
jgi:hypothetical protein